MAKQFKFSLERILQYRKIIEDQAQSDFQLAKADFEAAQKILLQFQDSIHTAQASRMQNFEQLNIQIQIENFIKLTEIKILQQRKKIEELSTIVEQKRLVLTEKSTDRKAVSKLKEKRQVEYDLEVAKYEERQLDELVTTRFQRSRTRVEK